MNKVLVELYCAATIKKYDLWLPKNMLIREVIKQIIEEIQIYEKNDTLFSDIENLVLYLYERHVVLNKEYTVEQSGIVSGQRIMIV
jgi:uncharacterized ubiquitin-like protein YukD